MIDTLRGDRLGAYGHSGKLTPRMDQLAAEGAVFERVIAPARWTQPSIASLLCGFYPSVQQVQNFEQALRQTEDGEPKVPVFDEAFVTLPEALSAGGYQTAAFVANPFILRDFGFAQGFEHFEDHLTGNSVPGSKITAAAESWLATRDSSRPLFLYLHYMDVHRPYTLDPRFFDLQQVDALPNKRKLSRREFDDLHYLQRLEMDVPQRERHLRLRRYLEYWLARYDAGVRLMDLEVGRLQAVLARAGVWNDALVVLTADHGEQLCERGQWDHGRTTFHTELHVPLILRWPGAVPPARRIDSTLSLIDVLPSLLDMLGIAPLQCQGTTFAPLIQEDGSRSVPAALAESVRIPPEQKALYSDGWKLRVVTKSKTLELYDIDKDPRELLDLSREHPERTARMRAALQALLSHNKRLATKIRPKQSTVSLEQLERLKSLGYVGD